MYCYLFFYLKISVRPVWTGALVPVNHITFTGNNFTSEWNFVVDFFFPLVHFIILNLLNQILIDFKMKIHYSFKITLPVTKKLTV